jgi:hypothetical protein
VCNCEAGGVIEGLVIIWELNPGKGLVTSGIRGCGVRDGIGAIILSRRGSAGGVIPRRITLQALGDRTMHHIRRAMMAPAASIGKVDRQTARIWNNESMLRVDGKRTLGSAALISCCISTAFRHVSGGRVSLTCKCMQPIIDKWAGMRHNPGCERVLPY